MLTKLCIYSIKCMDIMTTATTTVCFSSLLTSNIPQYKKILVPHDGSEMSDKALALAVYISKITGASIEMVHVIEHAKDILPSTLLAFIAPDKPLEKAKEDLKNMVKRRKKLSKFHIR
jgi:nucleotide-binding universal stress UspA family protein